MILKKYILIIIFIYNLIAIKNNYIKKNKQIKIKCKLLEQTKMCMFNKISLPTIRAIKEVN
jgi:hypothetical protein